MTDTRCVQGRLMRHDPQPDDPYFETDIGECPECEGESCDAPQERHIPRRAPQPRQTPTPDLARVTTPDDT